MRRAALLRAVLGLCLGALSSAACSGTGSTDAGDTATTMDGVSTGDDGPDVVEVGVDRVAPDVQNRIQCTTSDPGEGSFCDTDGLNCVYGRGDDLGCRRSYRCMNTRWANRPLAFACMASAMCPPAAPSGSMTACTAMNQGCTYSDGTLCVCRACDACMADAGMCTGPAVWRCSAPRGDASCPRPVPNLGTICLTDGQTCHYGPAGAGYSVHCTNGHWEQAASTCM